MVLLNINSDPFFIYKKCMRICGIWPLDAYKSRPVIVYSVFAFFQIVLTLSPLVALFAKCIVDEGKQQYISSVFNFLISLLLLTVRLYGSRLIPLIESTVDDWSSISDPKEWRIMKRHDKFGRYPYLIIIIWFAVYPVVHDVVLFVLSNTPTVLNDQQNRVGIKTLTWDTALNFLNIVMKLLEDIASFSSILLFWSLAMHLCGQYQILKQQFEEFLLIEDKKQRRKEFRFLVKRYNHLLDLSGRLENVFNIFLGIDIFSAQIFICIHATQLGLAIKGLAFIKMAQSFTFIALCTLYQYLYYHISDYLMTCAEMIGAVFTQCNWYNLSKESITDFSIIIARSRMPPRFTAAKLYKLDHSNFKYVLNGIYSYVSLIVAITKD